MTKEDKLRIAKACHAMNAAWAEHATPENPGEAWEDAPEWKRTAALAEVEAHLVNPNMNPAESHESWMEGKIRDGWVFGPVKDGDKKTHPLLIPYEDLPLAEQAKDALFKLTVDALKEQISIKKINNT